MNNQDQQHPRETKDRAVISELQQSEFNDHNLAELARLLIRYRGFPGARLLQQELQTILTRWQLTEEELYQKTRLIHSQRKIYRDRFKTDQQQDWT